MDDVSSARRCWSPGLIVGLVIGLFQAMTQIQEQSVVFVPKIVVMLMVLSVSLPWLISRMVQYTSDLIGGIPEDFSGALQAACTSWDDS